MRERGLQLVGAMWVCEQEQTESKAQRCVPRRISRKGGFMSRRLAKTDLRLQAEGIALHLDEHGIHEMYSSVNQ